MLAAIAYAADAAAPAGGASNPILAYAPLILMFGLLYFLMIRPQQKKQKELKKFVDSMKKGDSVVTSSGILGVIAGIKDSSIILKVGDGETKIEFLKSAVAGPAGESAGSKS
jgi:preprotein translocase subunit YajC